MTLIDSWTTPQRGIWQKVIDQHTVAVTSNEFTFPDYTKRLFLKVEYGANTGTAEQTVFLKDTNDVWEVANSVTPTNTANQVSIEETGYYHGEAALGTGEFYNLIVEGAVSAKVRTAAFASGISVWIMCV